MSTTPTTASVPSTSPLDLLFNAEKIDEAVNSSALTYIDRFSKERKTLAGAVASISAINTRGAWIASTAYAAKDVVSNSGTWYVCLTNHVSGSSFSGDMPTYWRIFQGLLQSVFDAFANSVTANTGGNVVGWNPSAALTAGGIGAAVQDMAVQVSWFLTDAERAQVKAGGDSIDLTPKIAAAKAFAGNNRPIFLMKGTWSFTSIDGKGWYGGLIGEGIGNTILKVRSSVATAIDFNETSDVIMSPFILKGFTLDGNGLATTGVNVRYRHHSNIEQFWVVNCTNGVVEKDAWNNRRNDCRTGGCAIGWWLVGSNHGTVFTGCAFTGCSTTQLVVQKNGTANDGNDGLLFSNCQAGDGVGTASGVDLDGTSITFVGSYLGENIAGAILVVRGGVVLVSGGAVFFGYTANSFMFAPVGGRTMVRNAKINGQAYGAISKISSGNVGGKFAWRDCEAQMVVGGDQAIVGDVLDYGPTAQVFTKRLGRSMSSSAANATRTELISGNKIRCTCLTTPGGTPNITITSPLTQAHPEWRDGENFALIVVYRSTADFLVRLSVGALGAGGSTVLATLKNTNGALWTAIKVDSVLPAAAYTLLEQYRDNVAANEYLEIEECFLADSRFLNKGAGVLGNLHKC